jgi:hypothetical protein
LLDGSDEWPKRRPPESGPRRLLPVAQLDLWISVGTKTPQLETVISSPPSSLGGLTAIEPSG